MALAQYSDRFWFPSGALATSVPARVFPRDSNALAALYTDATGITTLSNPLNTDGAGVLTFWAEEGEYWIHIDSETFLVSVGSPNLDVFEVAASTISTGVISGGHITVNAGNPGAVDITEMVGYVVDYTTNPFQPTATRVHIPAQTVAMDAGALARPTTWWMVTAGGGIVQQAGRPTNTQHRTHIPLGVTAQFGGSIVSIEQIPVLLRQPMNQFTDLMEALGPFTVSGNQVAPNGANMRINQSAGAIFARGINYLPPSGGAESDDPHAAPAVGQAPAQWLYVTQTSIDPTPVTVIDPTQYDNGGVLTAVGGGANSSTVQRVWLYPTGVFTNQLHVQYGQAVYSSLSTAVVGIGNEVFMQFPQSFGAAVLVGYIAVIRTATNLSDPTQATFVPAHRLALT